MLLRLPRVLRRRRRSGDGRRRTRADAAHLAGVEGRLINVCADGAGPRLALRWVAITTATAAATGMIIIAILAAAAAGLLIVATAAAATIIIFLRAPTTALALLWSGWWYSCYVRHGVLK